MNKREWERRAQLTSALLALGFTAQEAESLRRISNTLQRWYELECGTDGGCIERDEASGIPQWRRADDSGRYCGRPIPDREAGAKKRLAAILTARNARLGLQCEDRNWRCDDGTFDVVTADGELRLKNLPAERAVVSAFIQTDPRGAALYILRPGDVPEGADVSAYYTRGICVY